MAGLDPAQPVPQRPQLFQQDTAAVPEWAAVQQGLTHALHAQAATFAAFAACHAVAVYTDGSAPVRNPGGPAGAAAVLVGWAVALDPASVDPPPALVTLQLDNPIPARAADPATSNNRAEIAAVLTALAAVPHLGSGPWSAAGVTIWSDSNYTVYCGTGRWKRQKNTDLWPILDGLLLAAGKQVPGGVRLEWLKGHAGNCYNEAADSLATRAAFNFDETLYSRYRAAQLQTGREMPGAAALDSSRPAGVSDAPLPESLPSTWQKGTDYTLVLHTRLVRPAAETGSIGQGIGSYRLWARDGRSRSATLQLTDFSALDAAEYQTLIAALTDLLERIRAAGRDPAQYTLTVYSGQELVVRQLLGEYRVKAAGLQAPYARAKALLDHFQAATPVWQAVAAVTRLFAPLT